MASKKTTGTKRSRRATGVPSSKAPQRTRKRVRRQPPPVKAVLPEPIATFVF